MKKTFQVLNDMVRDGIIQNYAIVGAIGATFYVEPFATQDVDAVMKKYPDPTEFYRRKEAGRKAAAKRPIAEKLATVGKLRDVEMSLSPIRAANKARRAAKPIKIRIKTA